MLILRPIEPLSDRNDYPSNMPSSAGIEECFQIEESELMVEPMPGREQRNRICSTRWQKAEPGYSPQCH